MKHHDQKVIDVFFRRCGRLVRVKVENESAAELVRGLFPEYVSAAAGLGDEPGYSLAEEGGLRWVCARQESSKANSVGLVVAYIRGQERWDDQPLEDGRIPIPPLALAERPRPVPVRSAQRRERFDVTKDNFSWASGISNRTGVHRAIQLGGDRPVEQWVKVLP